MGFSAGQLELALAQTMRELSWEGCRLEEGGNKPCRSDDVDDSKGRKTDEAQVRKRF